MIKLFKILTLFINLLSIRISAQEAKFVLYQERGINIQYPLNWSLDNSGINGTSFLISSESEDIKDYYKENVNLIIQDLNGKNITLNKFIEITNNQFVQFKAKNVKIERLNDKIAYFEYELNQGILEFKFWQKVIIESEKAFVLTYTAYKKDYFKYLYVGKKIIESFYWGFTSKKELDILNFVNLKHKIRFKNLVNFERIELTEQYLIGMVDQTNNYRKSYSLKFNDDWSFSILDQETYIQEMTKDRLIEASKIIFRNPVINVYERNFPISNGSNSALHVIYTGEEIETNESMTMAVIQLIKNSKLYTFSCQCKSSFFPYFYNDCIKLFDSFKIE